MITIAHRTVVDENGKPESVLIPWNVFLELQNLLTEQQPNETTQTAMNETTEGMPRFHSVTELLAELNS